MSTGAVATGRVVAAATGGTAVTATVARAAVTSAAATSSDNKWKRKQNRACYGRKSLHERSRCDERLV